MDPQWLVTGYLQDEKRSIVENSQELTGCGSSLEKERERPPNCSACRVHQPASLKQCN